MREADWPLGLGTLVGGVAFIGIGSGAISVEVSGQKILVVVGAFFERVGLFLGIWPDLVPFVPQISRWLDWFYRLLQIPRNQDQMPGTGALFLSVTDPIGVHAVAALEMSDHEKIDALMTRTPALQGDAACTTTSAAPRSAPIPS